MPDSTITIARHVHQSLSRYLDAPSKERRFLLVDARAELERLWGVKPGSRKTAPPPSKSAPRTNREKILHALKRHRSPVTREVLVREAGVSDGSIGHYLTALVRSGVIVRRRPSLYELRRGGEAAPEDRPLPPLGREILQVLQDGKRHTVRGLTKRLGGSRSGTWQALALLCRLGWARRRRGRLGQYEAVRTGNG